MPGFASLLAASAALKVASLNLCTDELLLLLADDAQIASVTHLATQQSETALWHKARRHRVNDGSLLSVAGLKPDLVLTMRGGARESSSIARRLGMRVVVLPYPQSLTDIEVGVVQVAAQLGKEERGRQVLRQLNQLRRTAPKAGVDTIWLGGGGRSMAATGLASDWMRLAGLRQRQLQGDRVSLEQLLVTPPKVLLRSDYRAGEYSGEQRWMSHPLARRTRAGKTLATDGRRWTCMGPSLVPEILRLRRELAR